MASRFHVVPTSGIPIYRQLLEQVRTQIATGQLKPGEKLPSIRRLAQELEVNPMTVSKAYSLLERDGNVERLRGKGMFVADKKTPQMPLQTRVRMLEPLIEQVLAKAYELSIDPQRVEQAFMAQLKELEK